ncbi:MAG: hypothetical protein WC341_16045 [Bacteroidales bacterium]|jgi:hypothetical protein
MAALTITLSDLQAIRPVASNLGTATGVDRLSMYVDEARRLDLQPSLTAELLDKIDTDNTSPLTYALLRSGGTYVYESVTYTFAGLKKALSYFVYARLIKANPVNVTAFGVVNKSDPNSERTDYKMISNMANEAFNIGVAYLADCMDYIGRTFPTQTKSSLSAGKKFSISPIGD